MGQPRDLRIQLTKLGVGFFFFSFLFVKYIYIIAIWLCCSVCIDYWRLGWSRGLFWPQIDRLRLSPPLTTLLCLLRLPSNLPPSLSLSGCQSRGFEPRSQAQVEFGCLNLQWLWVGEVIKSCVKSDLRNFLSFDVISCVCMQLVINMINKMLDRIYAQFEIQYIIKLWYISSISLAVDVMMRVYIGVCCAVIYTSLSYQIQCICSTVSPALHCEPSQFTSPITCQPQLNTTQPDDFQNSKFREWRGATEFELLREGVSEHWVNCAQRPIHPDPAVWSVWAQDEYSSELISWAWYPLGCVG